jgi:membrane-associated phospholipid phosphatase
MFCFAFIDIPVAHWLRETEVPDGIEKFFEAAEHFGTFHGQVLALLLMYALHPEGRRRLFRVAAAAWCAGLAANIVKLTVSRCRPKYFDFSSVTASHGFLGIFDFGAGGSRCQGFPSAHMACAVGFCVALSHLFPRGRHVFALIAVLVGLQRMESSSHFASDVVAGALVGWLVGLLFTGGRIGRVFDAIEAPEP